MIINKEKQAGLNFNEFNKQRVLKERYDSIDSLQLDSSIKSDAKDRILHTISEEGTKFYLPTKTVMDLSSRVKVDIDTFDYKFLDTISEKKITFLLGDKFYRWTKTSEKINVFAACQVPIPEYLKKFYPQGVTHDISYVFFSFDMKHGALSLPPNIVSPFSTETVLEFLRLLIFTELSPIESKTINCNQSIGTRRAGKYKNESKTPVIVVDSTWNLNIVVTGEFIVSGFFRMQPCGKNWSKRELIWVSSFKKNGYTKGAKKNTFNT